MFWISNGYIKSKMYIIIKICIIVYSKFNVNGDSCIYRSGFEYIKN